MDGDDDLPTADELSEWLKPSEALDRLTETMREAVAKDAIASRLRSGRLRAVAYVIEGHGVHREPRGLCLIAAYRWPTDMIPARLWQAGEVQFIRDTTYQRVRRSDDVILFCHDVKFDPVGLAEFKTPLPSQPTVVMGGAARPDHLADLRRQQTDAIEGEPTPQYGYRPIPPPPPTDIDATPNKGGRPRKDFWESLLIAAAMAVYGGFQPKTMADVERWMADWLSANGNEAGEVSIRTRARAFFTAYVAERDKN